MNTLLGLATFLTMNLATVSHEEAERYYAPAYLSLATGDIASVRTTDNRQLYGWPVKVLSIGHTNASYQCYGGLSTAYFHHGLDLRADAGSDVLVSAGGRVVNVENYVPGISAYWEVAILDDDGFLWQYHHVERSSIPESILEAFKKGGRVEKGTKIGEVFSWGNQTFGEWYHHIHVNVLGKDKSYVSPFAFLEPLPDTQSPVIGEIALLKGTTKVPGTTVSGSYSIMAELKDLIMHQKFVVPPHEITIRVDNGSPQTVWKFDTLPGGPSQTDHVFDFYVKGLTCGDYNCRKPIVNLGFSKSGNAVFPLTPGAHEVEVEVRDYNGNAAKKSYSWSVE